MKNGVRVWLYQLMAVIASFMMFYSFSLPWWGTDSFIITRAMQFIFPPDSIKIYAYGLEHNFGTETYDITEYIWDDETPPYQTKLAWAYLGVSIVAIIASSFIKKKWGQYLLGFVGLTYIAYALVAMFVVIGGRLNELGIALQGWSSYIGSASMHTSIRTGWYLAIASGSVLFTLAVARSYFFKQKEQ